MEVPRAIVVGAVASLSILVTATASGADASSTAAFPISPPATAAETSPSSRAGFPAPQSSPPASRPPTSGASQPQRPWGTPSYAAPSAAAPAYPYGNGYGYGAPSYGPAGYGSNQYGGGYAPPGEKKKEPEKEAPRYVSLTLSAIRLVLPVFEPTLEARPTEHVGLAVFGGLGEATPKMLGFLDDAIADNIDRLSVREVGGQFLGYPFGHFDGLVLGGELLYTKMSGTVSAAESFDVNGSAIAFGPLVGGKWIHSSGFTLFAHAGVQRVWAKADWTVHGQAVSKDDAFWFPILNVNVGWSF